MKNKLKLKKILFAPRKSVHKYHDEMKELIESLFGYDIDAIFVSDKSSLYDFLSVNNDVKTIKNIIKKVHRLYGMDITPVKGSAIVDVVVYMLKKDKACFEI